LSPFVVGSVPADSGIVRIRLVRETKIREPALDAIPAWASAWESIDDEGGFAVSAELLPRCGNIFAVHAQNRQGDDIAVEPATVTILQGVTIGDPPVSRSIGVALANGDVHVYLDKGVPLPARRAFVHKTVDALVPGRKDTLLRIPLVQGEYAQARYCRLIGSLDITGEHLKREVPVGSNVEVTIEVDRGGRLSARALIPAVQQSFEHIASLVVPEASPEILEREVSSLLARLALLREQAADDEATRIQRLARELIEVEQLLERARGGDSDAAQRVRRAAIDLDAHIADIEARRRWPDLVDDAISDFVWAEGHVQIHGSDSEKRLFALAFQSFERARKNRSVRDVERQRRSARHLGHAAFFRTDDGYVQLFRSYASRVEEATNLKEAQKLIDKGRALAEAGDNQRLMPIVERLAELMPYSERTRRQSHTSGVR
jgi:molecular chaperone DnaK